MATVEQNRGGEPPSINQSKGVVDLVFNLPVKPEYQNMLQDAVGTVYADLNVLDKHEALMRQLGNGTSTQQVDAVIARMQEAAALRPVDETATMHRGLVLEGLRRIKEATAFNERVGQTQISKGIVIVQVGISPALVESAMERVIAAKKLIDEAHPTPDPTEENSPLEAPVGGTIFLSPEDPMYRPTPAEEAINSKPESPPVRSRQIRLSKREFLTLGIATSSVALGVGIPMALTRVLDSFKPTPPTEEQTRAADEAYIRKYSLTEQPSATSRDGWEVSYPTIEEGEEFVDVFNGSFRQISNGGNNTSLYILQGENYPMKVADPDIRFETYFPQKDEPKTAVWIKQNDGFPSSQPWYILSGKKSPENPEQKPFPNVVQIKSAITKQIFYVEAKPIPGKTTKYGSTEIIFMKKVKKQL